MAGLVPATELQSKSMRGGWVYILTNKPNGILYTGVTRDIARRTWQHREGMTPGFTRRNLALMLLLPRPSPSIAGKLMKGPDELFVSVGLRQEATALWEVGIGDHEMAGGEDEIYRRPSLPDGARQFETVHRSRHVDVGEDDTYVSALFEDSDGIIGVRSRDRLVAGFFDEIDSMNAAEKFVFHHQDFDQFLLQGPTFR